MPVEVLPQKQLWRIDGVLTAMSLLHVGDGEVRKREGETDVATVFRDVGGQPFIPGTSLRGFLRRCFENFFSPDSQETRDLFGFQDDRTLGRNAESQGGVLVVLDAFAQDPIVTSESSHVVIQRRTRTAAEALLYTAEVVPIGSKFKVSLFVEGIRIGDDRRVAQLLAVMNQIAKLGERLGAGGASNWGKLQWTLTRVSKLDAAAIQRWSKHGGLLHDRLSETQVQLASLPNSNRWLDLGVDLHFSEMFLVKDPDLSKKKGVRDDASDIEARRTPRDMRPLLPGHSFHGAIRSQAECIARTMAGDMASKWVRDVTQRAAYQKDLDSYTAIDLLFGGVGWKSPIRIEEDFCGVDAAKLRLQEFIAIDRFTGGGVEGLKFNARGFERPTLRGRVRIDLAALRWLAKKQCAPPIRVNEKPNLTTLWYLFGFVLQDLAEGDITFGFGASKGYGTCRATFSLNHQPLESFEQIVEAIQEGIRRG